MVLWKRSLRPAITPIGTPTTSESITAASISASVCIDSSHSPMRAKETSANSTIRPARQPPKRHTIATPAMITPGQVSHSSMSSSAATSQSASARKPSRIAKMTFGFSAVRWSRSHDCASSSSAGRSCQVSEVGQGNSFRQSASPASMSSTIPPTWTGRLRQREVGT